MHTFTFMFFSKLGSLVLVVAVASMSTACASAEVEGTSEDDVASSVRLQPAATAPALLAALEAASAESGTILRAETFTFDRARAKDSAVITALRRPLEHTKLRSDEGAMAPATLDATLEEYAVTDGDQRGAIQAALEGIVGKTPATRKLWLRSDDVPNADAEWAEVVGLFIAKDQGTAVRLVIRVEM